MTMVLPSENLLHDLHIFAQSTHRLAVWHAVLLQLADPMLLGLL